jgi:DNA ligase-1
VSGKVVMSVVDGLIDIPAVVRQEVFAQAVDVGEAVRMLLEQAHRKATGGPPLTLLEVSHTFEQIAEASGKGSRARKSSLIEGMLTRASPIEAKYLVKVIHQEMRHGVNEGILLDGIAKATGISSRLVRRANQLWGDVGEVALTALTEGRAGLRRASLRPFRPVKPMLAQTAEDLAEAFELYQGNIALEYKLDGARVQIHACDAKIRIYSRQLSDVTGSLPDVVSQVREKLGSRETILEGEAIAVDSEARPLPFQHLMRRFRRVHDIAQTVQEIPVRLYLFDALYVDGRSLVDMPNSERWSLLQKAAGALELVPRLVPETPAEGEAFAETAYQEGHEGVMIKDLDSAYNPGVRGKSWLKLKHTMSLDLVIVAADWGYGRRHGWLSNYHLAALDEESGDYLVVGKTFKGLTDQEFQEMTERLLSLEQSRQRSTVFVGPRVVVEVLFNEVQASSQYRSGLALRFARIRAIRDDKKPAEADTLETLCRVYNQQFRYKGRLD